MSTINLLKEKLIGNFYSRFSVGDTFDLYFHDFWLISQNIVSSDEEKLNNELTKIYAPVSVAVDQEDIAKSIIISSTQRKRITDLSLGCDSTLNLTFENGVTLTFPTDTEVVDWHWAINKNGEDPYLSSEVACFTPGELQ